LLDGPEVQPIPWAPGPGPRKSSRKTVAPTLIRSNLSGAADGAEPSLELFREDLAGCLRGPLESGTSMLAQESLASTTGSRSSGEHRSNGFAEQGPERMSASPLLAGCAVRCPGTEPWPCMVVCDFDHWIFFRIRNYNNSNSSHFCSAAPPFFWGKKKKKKKKILGGGKKKKKKKRPPPKKKFGTEAIDRSCGMTSRLS